jgi:hypothetical protein
MCVETLIRELAGLVRAGMASWPDTVRLCLLLLAVAAASVAVRMLMS